MTVPVLIAALTFAPLSAGTPRRPLSPPARADAGNHAQGTSDRLRPQGRRVTSWLRDARQRSPTVRRLIERIEQSDVIVYLDISRGLSPNVSACLTWMAATSSRRLVRASFRHDLRSSDAIGLLAHELQHVVEVIEHPEVRSTETLLALYTRIGHATGDNGLRWDTADAVAVGTLARLEATLPFQAGSGDLRKGT